MASSGLSAQTGGAAMGDAMADPTTTLPPLHNATSPLFPTLLEFGDCYANVHGYIAVVVCVWAIVANLANIIVLTRKNMLSATNAILTWLAVADLLTMTSYFPVSIHFYITREPNLGFTATRSHAWISFMLFHINFAVVCHTIAIWLTIVLATFRFLFIWYPTHGMTLCNMRRAKLAIAAVYVSTTVICLPNYLMTDIHTNTHTQLHAERALPGAYQNTSVSHAYALNATHWAETFRYYILSDGDLAQTWPVLKKCNYWIQALCIKLVPCALLTILTILLIIAMHQANRRRRKLKSQGRKDESDRTHESNRTTAMLLAIVALFLIVELPQGLLTLSSIFEPRVFADVYWPLGDLLDMLALLNNSINFVLYCSMSKQFRDTFVQTFCSCCPESRPGWLKIKTYHSTSNGTNVTSV